MRIAHDVSADAAYIYLDSDILPGAVSRTVSVNPNEIDGMINLDFGLDGRLLGVEVLDASRFLSPELLASAETS